MKLKKLVSMTNIIILFLALLSINFLASGVRWKCDLTGNRLYTLSEGSKKIIAGIDDEAVIKYFFSSSHETMPVLIKNYGKRVEELLREFADHSPRLTVETYDPRPDSDEEELAAKYGITSAQVGDGDAFYMGAAVFFRDKTYSIPFFDPRKENFLEYEIANMLARLKESGARKPLGILAGVPLTPPPQLQMTKQVDEWLFVKELKKVFEVRELESDPDQLPEDISLLLVVHPKAISDKAEYALEQYILSGGKAVLVVDPSAQSVPEQASAYARYGMQESSRSDLKRIFAMLQLEYDPRKVVADSMHATRVNTGSGSVQYPYWLSLDESSFNRQVVLTSQLNSALFVESGAFALQPDSKHEYVSLINTGDTAGTIDAQQLRFQSTRNFDNYEKAGAPLSLAGIVTGTFRSAFGRRPEGSEYKGAHVDVAGQENSVLVIADVDFLNNRFALRQLNFFGQKILQPINQNLTFLTNALEFISGSSELISIRSRGSFSRPFDRVEEIEKKAQAKWFSVEQDLTQKIQELQKKLNDLQQAKTKDNQLLLSREQQDEIARFKTEQLEFKRRRREVRKNLRQDIERLGTILTVLNMTVVPLIVLLTGLYIYVRRSQGRAASKRS